MTSAFVSVLLIMFVLGFWQVPYSFWRWSRFKYREPQAGQVWAFARLTPWNSSDDWHTFEVMEVTDSHVLFQSNWIGHQPDLVCQPRTEWEVTMKKIRGWIMEG